MTQLEQRQLGGWGLRIAQIAGLTSIAEILTPIAEILMIARRQQASTPLTKARNPLTVRYTQSIAGVDSEQP
jgi:hypothetical protein